MSFHEIDSVKVGSDLWLDSAQPDARDYIAGPSTSACSDLPGLVADLNRAAATRDAADIEAPR